MGCFSGCQLVMRKHFLGVWPKDGTVAPGLLDKVEQVIVGFSLKVGEDLLAQPAVVFPIQALRTCDVMSGSPHKSPVVWRAVSQIPDHVIVVGEIDSTFFFDTRP